jgi:hypothetical protein
MSKTKPRKSAEEKQPTDEAAEAAREKELQELIEQVEKKQSRGSRPERESPHDFVQRRMRQTSKK